MVAVVESSVESRHEAGQEAGLLAQLLLPREAAELEGWRKKELRPGLRGLSYVCEANRRVPALGPGPTMAIYPPST